MKSKWILVLACLVLTACGQPTAVTESESSGGESAATAGPVSIGDLIADIQSKSDREMEGFMKVARKEMQEYQSASKERQAAIEEKMEGLQSTIQEKVEGWLGEAMTAIEKDPTEKDAFDALAYVVQSSQDDDRLDKATSLLTEHHADAPEMESLCGMMAEMPNSRTESFLKTLSETSPYTPVKAAASLGLIRYYQGVVEFQNAIKGAEDFDAPEYVSSFDASSFDAEAMLDSFVKDYGDVESQGSTYAEIVKPDLFTIKHLSVGKVAPDIEGIDLDDEPFKLSDYRGKVVLLDFWGDW